MTQTGHLKVICVRVVRSKGKLFKAHIFQIYKTNVIPTPSYFSSSDGNIILFGPEAVQGLRGDHKHQR